ncbi:hypothetical protein PHLGIDRAFT_415210 [Phlebiopsis gigantea 11061_1 CR5-6]|uniref:Uncharacterized protein n=1 Tax=Phlebiopsis gigantea (strain 11061_1 CR5-6) TaxID=745531 RepID=A0A0C3SAZ1_PHLG1|nr:hypothetical protein PHLGIDRAFT_415210 [Phlebiopsis gigantea 11061_1 CR5-6]
MLGNTTATENQPPQPLHAWCSEHSRHSVPQRRRYSEQRLRRCSSLHRASGHPLHLALRLRAPSEPSASNLGEALVPTVDCLTTLVVNVETHGPQDVDHSATLVSIVSALFRPCSPSTLPERNAGAAVGVQDRAPWSPRHMGLVANVVRRRRGRGSPPSSPLSSPVLATSSVGESTISLPGRAHRNAALAERH